ncbi:hypothetical protein D3C78_1839710 [compost metagenome]
MVLSPLIAAIISRPPSSHGSMPPVAHTAPAMKSRESPGRKGITTRPVSQKMTRKRMA